MLLLAGAYPERDVLEGDARTGARAIALALAAHRDRPILLLPPNARGRRRSGGRRERLRSDPGLRKREHVVVVTKGSVIVKTNVTPGTALSVRTR